MDRVKVNLPSTFSFSTEISIRISDINYGGHVGNDAFLALIHEARLQFLARLGYSELNIAGVGLIMSDVAIEYKRELVYGDRISISITADGFDKIGFDFFYLLEVINQDGSRSLAGKAKTGMVCFDYAKKKRASLPSEAMQRLKS